MKIILFLLCVVQVSRVSAQDERLVRDLLSGKLVYDNKKSKKKEADFKVRTGRYRYDLNNDGRKESFFFAKRDGLDWLYIKNHKGQDIFKYQFDTLGTSSRAYKMDIRQLSRSNKVFLIHFYEGVTKYIEMKGTARLYLLTLDNNDLKSLSMKKGPYLWEEFRDIKSHYHQRKNTISLFDFDHDGVREIAVRYNLISKVLKYAGSGKWLEFN